MPRRPGVAGGIDEEFETQDTGQISEVFHPTYGIQVADYAPGNRHAEILFWANMEGFLDKNASNARQVEGALHHDGDEPGGGGGGRFMDKKKKN